MSDPTARWTAGNTYDLQGCAMSGRALILLASELPDMFERLVDYCLPNEGEEAFLAECRALDEWAHQLGLHDDATYEATGLEVVATS